MSVLRSIMDEQPAQSPTTPRKHRRMPKDIRPAVILGLVLVYSVTLIVGATTVIVLNINGNGVAQACIETGGEWVISDSGARECIRPASSTSSKGSSQ